VNHFDVVIHKTDEWSFLTLISIQIFSSLSHGF